MANRVLAYATDAEPTMHESGQEYMEGMWESVTIERSAAGQPGLMIVMERRDGEHGRKCPSKNCNVCGTGLYKRVLRRLRRRATDD